MPEHPAPGDKVIVTYRVKNLGPDRLPSGSYATSVKADSTEVNFDNAGNSLPLEVGAHVQYSRASGSHDFILREDSPSTVSVEVRPDVMFASDPDRTNDVFTFDLRSQRNDQGTGGSASGMSTKDDEARPASGKP